MSLIFCNQNVFFWPSLYIFKSLSAESLGLPDKYFPFGYENTFPRDEEMFQLEIFFGFFNNLTVAMVMNVRNCFLFLHPVFKDYNYIPKASRKYVNVYWGYI